MGRHSRETTKVKPARGILNPSIERFELVVLERSRLVSVFEVDDDASFLYLSNTKSVMGEWRNERCTFGKIVEFVEKRVPPGGEKRMRWLCATPSESC